MMDDYGNDPLDSAIWATASADDRSTDGPQMEEMRRRQARQTRAMSDEGAEACGCATRKRQVKMAVGLAGAAGLGLAVAFAFNRWA
jgi:hypothetical protein